MAPWCSGLTYCPVKAEIAGSNPVGVATNWSLSPLHNHLYQWWLSRDLPELASNSLTGVGIAMVTTGTAFLFYLGGLSPDSTDWLFVFLGETLVLLLAYALFALREKSRDASLLNEADQSR